MKYNQKWQQEIQNLPSGLRDECLNYKQFKKMVKKYDTDTFLELLQSSLDRIDRIFRNSIKTRNNILQCFGKMKYTQEDLYKFAKINKQSVYKIIKKYDKKKSTHISYWYNNNNSKYQFNNGYLFKRLEYELFGCKDECPICLEEPKILVIFDCGHFACDTCTKSLYHVNGMKGTLHNLVNYSIYQNKIIPCCPICRSRMLLRNIHNKQIYSLK